MATDRPVTILYVEDDESNRLIVRRALARKGYAVLDATDAQAGLALAIERRPDLILMDMDLGPKGLDGFELTAALRARPELADTPIVALTASVIEEDREKVLAVGCVGYLSKPVDVRALGDQVAAFLGGYRETVADHERLAALRGERLDVEVRRIHQRNQELERANAELAAANAQLRRFEEARRKYLFLLSHELRTPVTIAQGNATIIDKLVERLAGFVPENAAAHKAYEEVRISAGSMERATVRLTDIIRTMLLVLELESEVGTFEPVSMAPLIRDCVGSVDRQARQGGRQVPISCTLHGGDQCLVDCDASYLRKAIEELLRNAVKFTPDGGQILLVLTPTTVKDVACLDLSISDTGIGVNPEERDLVFSQGWCAGDINRHSTATAALEYMGEGLGFGLYIVRRVALLHKGWAWCESSGRDPGRLPGSAFHLLLPVKRPSEPTSLRVGDGQPAGGGT